MCNGLPQIEDLHFEVSYHEDENNEVWWSFRLVGGGFDNHVFFITDMECVDGLSYCYAKLNPQGREAETLEPTPQSNHIAMCLKDFFLQNRKEVVEHCNKRLYNK